MKKIRSSKQRIKQLNRKQDFLIKINAVSYEAAFVLGFLVPRHRFSMFLVSGVFDMGISKGQCLHKKIKDPVFVLGPVLGHLQCELSCFFVCVKDKV